MSVETPLYARLAAAYVRGRLGATTPPGLPAELRDTPLDDLGDAQLDAVMMRMLRALEVPDLTEAHRVEWHWRE